MAKSPVEDKDKLVPNFNDDDDFSKYSGKSLRESFKWIDDMKKQYKWLDDVQKQYKWIDDLQKQYGNPLPEALKQTQKLMSDYQVYGRCKDELAPFFRDQNKLAIENFFERHGLTSIIRDQDLSLYTTPVKWQAASFVDKFDSQRPIFEHISSLKQTLGALESKFPIVTMVDELNKLVESNKLLPPHIQAVYELKLFSAIETGLPALAQDTLHKAQASIGPKFASNYIQETTCFFDSEEPPHKASTEIQRSRIQSVVDSFGEVLRARKEARARLHDEKDANDRSFELLSQILPLIAQKIVFADESFRSLMRTSQAFELDPEERVRRLEQILQELRQKREHGEPN